MRSLKLAYIAVGLFLISHVSYCYAGKPKGASLTLKARFNATSYLLEAVEFLAEEDASLAWAFIDRMSDSSATSAGASASEETCWRDILQGVTGLVTPGVAKLAPLVLASRQYAAKLEMIRQLASQFHSDETACCYVSLDGQVATTPLSLADLLKAVAQDKGGAGEEPGAAAAAAEQLYPFDHVYPGGAGNASSSSASGAASSSQPRGRHVAILYGTPGLPCFTILHQHLKLAVRNLGGRLTYVFRPLLTAQCEAFAGCARAGTGGQLLLPGWGVEAALKNTEYSAMDDKEAAASRQRQGLQDSGAAPASDNDDPAAVFGSGSAAVVKGFRLDVLAARRPALRQELLTFRDQLLAADDDEAALKVWDLRDVGLQATQRILGSADPLGLLAELSQNFPGIVSSLSRQPVNASLRTAVGHNQQMVSAGANFLLLNGLAVDVNDFDYFGFLTRLRHELRLRDSLVAPPLELPPALAQQLLAARAEDSAGGAGGGGGEGEGSAEPRLSLGPSSTMTTHVAFLNDLEADAKYQRFSRSVTDLLNTFPGRLRPLARNVFTAVLVVQPLCSSSLELAAAVDRMWQQGYPIRFGVVFHLPSVVSRVVHQRRYPFMQTGAVSWDNMDTSERFGRAFATLREAFGQARAWAMWIAAAEEVAAGEVLDPAALVETAFTSAWADAARSPPPGARAKAAARKSGAAALQMLKKGEGYAAEAGMRLAETASWLLARGLVQPPDDGDTTTTTGGAGEGEDAERCDAPPTVWLNGAISRPEGSAPDDLMYKVMSEMQRLQELVYYGRLDDSSGGGDVLAAVLGLTGAVERLNPRIVGPQAAHAQFISTAPLLRHEAFPDLVPLYRSDSDNAASKSKSKSKSKAAANSGGGAPHVAAATHYVVVDLGSDEGRELFSQAARWLSNLSPSSKDAPDARLVFVFNPERPSKGTPTLLEVVVRAALIEAGPGKKQPQREAVVDFLGRLTADPALVARLGGDIAAGSAEEAMVALTYAEQAGLDSKRLLTFIQALVDDMMTKSGAVRGGTASLKYRQAHRDMVAAAFGLPAGAAAVVSNGRLTTVFQPGGEYHELLAEDFPLLQMVAGGGMARAVVRTLQKAQQDGVDIKGVPSGKRAQPAEVATALADLASAVTAALAASQRSAPPSSSSSPGGSGRLGAGASLQLQQVMSKLKGQALEVPGGPDAPFHLEALLNPLSRSAQRLSAVLLLLREALGPSMALSLNPQRDVTEMPLKSYYRYALPQGLASSSSSASAAALPGAPSAYFARLPSRRVLTLNMDVPEAWLVEPAAALYDLDNLRLEDVAGEVAFAEFELDALMLTGSCVDVTSSGRLTPPRGLQLHLGTPAQPHQVDTLVMANLAYFQLKAAPGRWLLSLAPGRSRELYTLESSTGASLDSVAEEEVAGAGRADASRGGGSGSSDDISTQVLISSFQGKHMILRVRKRPGMEAEDVLKEAGAGGGQDEGPHDDEYDHYGSSPDTEDDEYDDSDDKPQAGSGKQVQQHRKLGGDVINVFTVASGHMYERLQKIMILSVIRNTKSRVKFWIISNYISPQHRQVIPALAAKFGFDYQFVTYKWPGWLHKQTDKQRLIWAYKILFLDVLFPLGVERIIFVDSDQVVRSDLADLYHMDIKGAPYAYTPFCDNNKEMDEYRFWKGGFWRDHLQGKPYHISALYLVDLKRFRQIAAGDQLRVVYDQLSKDPNSLANLDQDLPNYAQHSIKIFSLPQEWLWCESWCGNATKARAKTIDLCNNPKTKEPKLTAARRIIGPTWEELDAQQEGVTRLVQEYMAATEAGLPEEEAVEAAAGGQQQPGSAAGGEGVWVEGQAAEGGKAAAATATARHGDRSEL